MTGNFSSRALGALLLSTLVAGCAADVRGPSVPFRQGASLDSARAAFAACTGDAHQAGQATVTGHYVGSVLWGGVVVGPIFVASQAPTLRYNGEINGMDRCMKKRGFVRRDLTPQEMRALEQADQTSRRMMLDHLVGGGSLATFARS